MPALDYTDEPDPPQGPEGADRTVIPSVVGTALLVVWVLALIAIVVWEKCK